MTRSILLADDEQGIRNVLSIYLEDMGYLVETVEDGKKAVRKIKDRPFDIVLTDIKMPGMTGVSLLKYIKGNSPDTEVIMITGHGDLKLAIDCLKLDAVDFITKPINNDILDIALKRAEDRITTRRKMKAYTRNLETRIDEKTRELLESEKRYRRLFNDSPSYITIQNKDLTILETNRIFKRDFSFQDGMRCFQVYKGRSAPCPGCPVIRTFEDGRSHTAEMEVVLADAGVRNIFIQTSPITDSNGRVRSVMEMSTDVTMIHELQDHLAALGLHISSVSHGLKQMLTGLDGGSYLIESGLKKRDHTQITEGWQMVKEKMSRTRQMVLDILFHSKKRELNMTRTAIPDLIKEVVSVARPKARQEKIIFDTGIPESAPRVRLDRVSVLNALTCILENAMDASLMCRPPARPRVRFTTRITPETLLFTIEDNGPGIGPAKQEKIFNLFYSDKGNKGTGLGLFIAMRSVKQHGGTISVDSRQGAGTRFIITLPRT